MNYSNFKYNFLLIFLFQNLCSFKDINQAINYIKNYPEFPKYDDNIESGNFTTFYKTLIKSRPRKNLNWTHAQFIKDLKKENQQIKLICQNQKNSVLLELKQDSKIILWGDIQAGFHSLLRSLYYLFNTKVIDKDFKIIEPNTYFVFNGNLIGLGPYPIETLDLVLNLMAVNKNKVFYIKGQEESLHIWPKHSLQKEIDIMQKNIDPNNINNFFQNLPETLFLKLKNNRQLLSISFFGPVKDNFYQNMTQVIKVEDKKNQVYDFKNIISKEDVIAFIKGNPLVTKDLSMLNKNSYAPNFYYGQGLYRLDSLFNKIAWTTKSCPIQLYRMKYNFFYDAFTVIDFKSNANNLGDSTIIEYFKDNQNQNTKQINQTDQLDWSDNFKRGPCYNVTTGELIKVGASHLRCNISFKNFNKDSLSNKLQFIDKRTDSLQKNLDYLKSNLREKFTGKKPENQIIEDSNFDILAQKINNKDFNEEDIYNVLISAEENLNLAIKKLEQIEQLAIINNITSKTSVDLKSKNSENVHQKPKELVIGTSAPLTRIARGIGKPLRQGISLAVSDANKLGGINNNFIKLVFLNDKYTPYLFERNIKNIFYDYQTNLLLLPEGTKSIKHAFDFIQNNNMFIFFSASGAGFLRDPKLKNVINYRASYSDEGKTLVNYIIKEHGNTNFLFFYQDDEFGNEVLKGAKSALEEIGIKTWAAVPYMPNTSALKKAALEIKQSNSNTIGFFSLGTSAIALIREVGVEFFANKFLFGCSPLSDAVTLRVLKSLGLKILMSEVVPSTDPQNSPDSGELEIVKEYREKLNKHGYEPNAFSLEAYICASIFLDQVSKIGADITGEKIMENLEKIKNYNFKGLKLNFNPENRTLSTSIWLKTIENIYIKKAI